MSKSCLAIVLAIICVATKVLAHPKPISIPVEKLTVREDITSKVLRMTRDNSFKAGNMAAFTESKSREIDLENYKDFQYYAPLYIGSNTQGLNFIFDTGSEWLWVPLNTCSNCRAQTLYTPSSSYEVLQKDQSVAYLYSSVSGEIANDQVRILPTDDAITMRLLGVTKEENIDGTVADGILGLAPASHNNSDLFVDKLRNANMIANKTFGLNINNSQKQSTITLGGYDTQLVQDFNDIVWLEIQNDLNWWVPHSRIYIGDFLLTSKGGLTVFDSGTSLTTFQTNIYYALLQVLFKATKNTCVLQDYSGTQLYHCPCTSVNDFQNITIDMRGNSFYLKPETYVTKVSNICVLMIDGANFSGNTDIILLGSNFFFNYYVYYDADRKQIGLYGEHEKAVDHAMTLSTVSALLLGSLLLFTNLF